MRTYSSAMAIAAIAFVIALSSIAGAGAAHAVLPLGNTVAQWDKIAEDTVVGSGAFQNEGLQYMAYTTDAMYRSITPGRRLGQSPDAAVIESAYTVLSHYFPTQQATLDSLHTEALAALPNDQTKVVGMRYGRTVALDVIAERAGDGLADTDRVDVVIPDARPWAGRVASHPLRLCGTADAVGRADAAVHPPGARTSSCLRRRLRSRAPRG